MVICRAANGKDCEGRVRRVSLNDVHGEGKKGHLMQVNAASRSKCISFDK